MPKRSTSNGDAVLTRRALNRGLLERQMLLQRVEMPIVEAVERLVGMQAQATNPPYVGLWSRLHGFAADDLSQLIADRTLVRIALMRSTIHLVSARDCVALRPVMQPALVRGFPGAWTKRLAGADPEEVAAAARPQLEERPRTLDDVGKRLRERWPESAPAALGNAARAYLALVQVPPRGLWGRGGAAAHTTAEAWLGRPPASETAADGAVMRYLAAFGPASVADAQTWSGLTGLRAVFERLRPHLRVVHDDAGRELFDLRDAPLPDADTPAPPRFLGDYDNALLSHADRTRILPDEYRSRLFVVNRVLPSFLVDGFVAGTWEVVRDGGTATLRIHPFAPLSAADRDALETEGAGLLLFHAPEAKRRRIDLNSPAS
jgi:hypothetical protein